MQIEKVGTVLHLWLGNTLLNFIFLHLTELKNIVFTRSEMSFQLTSSAKNAQLLGNILSLYLANDTLIHQNLSFILDIILNHRLFDESREPSDELAAVYRKWTVRMNALLQSKVVAARWCGIVLIKATCENSHNLMLANAKTWSAQLLGFVGVSTLCCYKKIESLTR